MSSPASFLPLFVVLSFFIFLCSPFPSLSVPLSLSVTHPPILTVRGDGQSPLSVDESEVTATIQSRIESPTPLVQASETNRSLLSIYLKSVANKTAAITDRVKQFLQSYPINEKITKLRTTSLSTTPLTQWKDGFSYYYGADSSHSFSFQTSIKASGPIIDDLIKIGVTRIDSVRLVSSDEALRKSRMAALSNATKNAFQKIQASIQPLGWNIGGLLISNRNNNNGIINGMETTKPNARVEILSMNIEGVTICPPPEPREMLSSMAGFAARMDNAEGIPVPPMPSSTVFSSDSTMTATVVMRVRITKSNDTNPPSTDTPKKNSPMDSSMDESLIIASLNRMRRKEIIESSTGIYASTGVVIAKNEETVDELEAVGQEIDEVTIDYDNNNIYDGMEGVFLKP